MTDRLSGYTIVFEHDIREDDAEGVKNAVLQLRGVIAVVPVVADVHAQMAETRAAFELTAALRRFLQERVRGAGD